MVDEKDGSRELFIPTASLCRTLETWARRW